MSSLVAVVFVTANHLHAFAAEVQRLGAVGLVLKPFSVEELLRPTLTALRRPPKKEASLAEVLQEYAEFRFEPPKR